MKFIDLFAGIGGFRIALENNNSKCVYSSEWDKYAIKTYEYNFNDIPFGDITKMKFLSMIFCVADFHAKRSVSLENKEDLKIQEELYFLILQEL